MQINSNGGVPADEQLIFPLLCERPGDKNHYRRWPRSRGAQRSPQAAPRVIHAIGSCRARCYSGNSRDLPEFVIVTTGPLDGSTPAPYAAPGWARAIRGVTDYLVCDFLGGPRPWKFAWVINFQKAGTFVFLLALIAYYDNASYSAWIYTAMQGSYGLVWILKDTAFPDPGWQRRITIGGGISAFAGVLGWYWVFGWLLVSGTAQPDYPLPDFAWFCLCISLCITGCAIMIAADAQKYFTLRVQRGLITDGMHRYVRHPNYLGEMMIYGSFAMMIWHWLPVVVLTWVWLGIFAVNMTIKEASMSRHPEWAAYRKRTWWLVPFLL